MMVAFKPIIMLVMLITLLVCVKAVDPVPEKLLAGLANSEVSLFTTTSYDVYHMETDKYKPGYVLYMDLHALKTSDGNISKTIAGHSTTYGYKEGVGEDARFDAIHGFTQISPTRVIVSDCFNHCLRLVDRVIRVASVFAGHCQSQGYQDGSSAQFAYPRAVMVDKRNSKQLLVADRGNRAVRTVDVESKSVGVFFKSDQLNNMWDLVQDKITGDIYITNAKSLYKLTYNTKSLNAISFGKNGQINDKLPGYLWGLLMVKTVILVPDSYNDRILKYDTAHDTWTTLNICDETKTHKNPEQCVTESPSSILLTSNRLLIGGNKRITSYNPPEPTTCPETQITLTSPGSEVATFQLQFRDQNLTINLPIGHHQHSIKGHDRNCNVTLYAEDYRVRRTLELVADYSVDCSALTSTVARSLLEDIAQQKYTTIEALCSSACKKPGNNAQPILSCNAVDGLKIRWPTDLVFTADVIRVPDTIRHALESRIITRGATLDVTVLGASPPIVYPRKAANGGYVSISLSTTCIDGLIYSDVDGKCV